MHGTSVKIDCSVIFICKLNNLSRLYTEYSFERLPLSTHPDSTEASVTKEYYFDLFSIHNI